MLPTSEEEAGEKEGLPAIYKRIPKDAESALVMVGTLDFLTKECCAFIRLVEARSLGRLLEVPVRCRFVTVILVPENSSWDYHEIGRSMGTLMSNPVSFFIWVCITLTLL